jgi:hypothetical protein
MTSVISRRFSTLRRRFKRSSSNYSIRSDFPSPPRGRERRLLSRASADIYPSSGDETPVFNTPQSSMTPIAPSECNINLLAILGTAVITQSLDRLSTSPNRTRPSSEMTLSSSDALPPSSSPTRDGVILEEPISTAQAPPNTSNVATVPSNSPSTPISPMRRSQKRRRAARSRLSEVTTPDDMASVHPFPEPCPLSIDSMNDSRLDLEKCGEQDKHELYPRPLAVNRQTDHSSAEERLRCGQLSPVSPQPPSSCPHELSNNRGIMNLSMNSEIEVPDRLSSVGKIPSPNGSSASSSAHEEGRSQSRLDGDYRDTLSQDIATRLSPRPP